MVDGPGQLTRRGRGPLVVGIAVVLVVVGALGLVWATTRPSTSTACTLGGSINVASPGAATPEGARSRWAAELHLEIDVERPDRVSGSGDTVTATYLLDRPDLEPVTPNRTHFREIVTERGDDRVWRVVDSRRCEQWTS